MKYLSLITLGIVLFMSANLPAVIEVYNEPPVEDAYIDSGATATGVTFNSDVLQIQGLLGSGFGSVDSKQRSFFQFDVSSLADKTILSVEFGVYVNAYSKLNTPSMVLTYFEDDSWDEGDDSPTNDTGINWDDWENLPLPGSSTVIGGDGNSELVDGVGKYYTWDIYIKDSATDYWNDDQLEEEGLVSYMLTVNDEDDFFYAYFPSSEAAENQPYLKIEYIPEPASMVLLGLGAVLIRKRRGIRH